MATARTTPKLAWLSAGDCGRLRAWADIWAPLEVGGILLGYRCDQQIVVTHLVGPGPNALHSHFTFEPDHAYQVAELERIYGETAGTSVYLGDWHTHPGGVAYPSAIDHRTLRRIARSRAARCPYPLMLIAAGHRGSWTACAFTLSSLSPSRKPPVAVALKSYDETLGHATLD